MADFLSHRFLSNVLPELFFFATLEIRMLPVLFSFVVVGETRQKSCWHETNCKRGCVVRDTFFCFPRND